MASKTKKTSNKERLTLWVEPELALKIQQVEEEDYRPSTSATIRYLVILGMGCYFSANTQA